MFAENDIINPQTEICRLCLAHTKVYFSLTQNRRLARILKAVTAIEVQPSEQISSVMCVKCRLNLNLAYKIQQNMVKAEEKFRMQYCIVQIKEEINDLLDELKETPKEEISDYYCSVCNKSFRNRESYRKHSYYHVRKKCPTCDKEIIAPVFGRHLRMHEREPIQSVTEFLCNICDKYFSNKENLRHHINDTHTKISCQFCDKELMKGSLGRHIRRRHPDEHKEFKKIRQERIKKMYKCEFCSKSFQTPFKLKRHQSKYEKSNCSICGKELVSAYLEQHMELHANHDYQNKLKEQIKTESNNVSCDTCGKTFVNERILKRHQYFHRRATCPICHLTITKVNLHHHIKTHSDAYVAMCELCGATLKNKNCLKLHTIRCHQDVQFKCKYCEKSYKTKSHTRLHELKEHLRDAKFVCDVCGKKFYSSMHLKKHVELKHLKLRPYPCDVCNKAFGSNFALKTHQRIHTNETPYKCQECGEGFRQKVSLRTHLKSKHKFKEELTHFCEACGKGFGSAAALYSHKRVHD